MFKKKENRDTILLIFMAAAFIGFLAYLFLPQAKGPVTDPNNNGGKVNSNQQQNNKIQNNTKSNNAAQKSSVNQMLSEEEATIKEINTQLKEELNRLYIQFKEVQATCENLETAQLGTLLDELILKVTIPRLKEQLKKIQNVSFFDLPEYYFGYFSFEEMEDFKFNLYLALFLTKINYENTLSKICGMPEARISPLLHLKFYQLLEKEVQEDYQLLPVVFFFYILSEKADIFTPGNLCRSLHEELKGIRDLTPSKLLLNIKESLELYREKELFQISWVEEDGLSSNDKGNYKNQELEITHFLNQKYIVFDLKKAAEYSWIKELCDADTGDIELVELQVFNQSPSKNQKVQKILYTPNGSMFMVMLEQEFLNQKGILAGILKARMARYFRNYKKVDFNLDEAGKAQFKKDLKDFGNYLKSVYSQ